ncbi:6,7-dimethyl-8-ribityllumazine synthase [Myxococcus sp. K15C18031901]|uniref:6,7-dimethyl-8-ribityllumazine synthase n=1 Tax=Myxococcus dinghuensis TaxID=2906761 RepID=UPI0020A7EB81|nr:6,7-dimethyl-8-ribityllumazine synthase [Myxococcus dinghuensis]MCP3101441.1 6,7-dimethyl-8-ribityllumazine synthase [Myxococcus dinghuensis]
MPRYIEGDFLPPKGRFAICVARFNGFITEELAKGAVDTLVRHGVPDADVDVYRCPGTYELPGLVRRVAESRQYVGVVALGAVIRGGTPHFDYVAGECAKGIGSVAFNAAAANPATAVTFGVLTTDTVEQAIDRAGVKAGNKGAEATLACIEMVNLFTRMAHLDGKKG